MTRDEAKEYIDSHDTASPCYHLLQAFALGLPIEWKCAGRFIITDSDKLSAKDIIFGNYRIKPEPQYRAFKDAKEFEPYWNWYFYDIDELRVLRVNGYNYNKNGISLSDTVAFSNGRVCTFEQILKRFSMSSTLTGKYQVCGILDEVQDGTD